MIERGVGFVPHLMRGRVGMEWGFLIMDHFYGSNAELSYSSGLNLSLPIYYRSLDCLLLNGPLLNWPFPLFSRANP